MTIAQIICLVVVVLISGFLFYLINKKAGDKKVCRFIALAILSVILICAVIFWKTSAKLFSVIILAYFAIMAGYFIVTKSKSYNLVKWSGLFLFIAIALTWIFQAGGFQQGSYMEYGMVEQGLTDLPNLLYQAIYLAGDKIIFLLALGMFYGVLSKTSGYKKIVSDLANKFSKNVVPFVLVISLLVVVLTAMLNQTFAVLIFIPFLITVLLNMKLDKISVFATTFGSMLIGLMGVLYGSENAEWFTYYIQGNINNGLVIRLLVLVVSFILLNLFNVLHIKKNLKEKVNDTACDKFEITKVDKKAKYVPTLILMIIMSLLVIIGYIGWSARFGVDIFNKFHEWLVNLSIGNVYIFKSILGSSASAFGSWSLFQGIVLLVIFSILFAIADRMKASLYLDACKEGIQKMLMPLMMFLISYMIMMAAYVCPFVPSIMNSLFGNLKAFSPIWTSIGAFISHIFHVDMGYTGYIMSQYIITTYASKIDVIQTIYLTTYGLVALFVPSQALLLIGLSYLDVDYKAWIKFIWKFILIAVVLLVILFVLI